MRQRLRNVRFEHVAWLISAALGIGLATSRLLGIHGPESALALGVALPPFAAVLGARAAQHARETGEERELRVLGLALRRGLLLWGLPTLILALNQLRVRNCTPLEGFAFLVLGPGLGVALATLIGVAIGAWIPRRRLAITLAVLTPIAADLAGLWAFWSTPAIFVYDHFAGWFPGTLYDDDVGLPTALLTFRVVTILWAGVVLSLIHALWRPDLGGFRRPRVLPATVAVLLASGAIAANVHGPSLGHRTAVASIDEALGQKVRGERCIVHAPRELDPAAIRRLREDCDFRVMRAERALGVTQQDPVHAYFYRSADEKRRWMGAGGTFIAKPWRNEVHLQLREWPHSVLAHEVVHVVAGNAAVGPFRVSGTIGGWLPNPGLIEGIAVAIEWPERDGMTPHQYCRALKEMDRLPRLDDLMGLSFLSLPASQAYTGAGSFVRWLLDTRGPEVVREMHRSGTVASLGEDMETLEAAWRASLDEVVLPPGALDLAELRFARSSIFQSTCPHALARLRRELGADLAAGDHARVVATCDELLAIEPAELSALVTRPGALARMGDLDAAVAALEAVEGAPPPLVWRARERVADARWIRGQRSSALDTYRELLRGAQSDGDARQREVKSLAIGSGGPQERLIRDLLVGPQGRGVNSTVAVHLAREIDRFRGDGLGRYLEARQLMAQGRYDLALPSIEEAERRGLPTERIRDEALRMIAITLFATGDLSRSEQRWREALERPRLRNMAEEWLDRIEFHRR